MPLSCDGAPVTDWTIRRGVVGPFVVEGWQTSFKDTAAYRVVGKSGLQLHARDGCVIMVSREYAQAVCDSANNGVLNTDA